MADNNKRKYHLELEFNENGELSVCSFNKKDDKEDNTCNDGKCPVEGHKLYILLLSSLSDSQKQIQAAHVAFSAKTIIDDKNTVNQLEKENDVFIFQDKWNKNDLLKIESELAKRKIPFVAYRNRDLNYTLTAIGIVIDERVYDNVKYPDQDFDYNPYKIITVTGEEMDSETWTDCYVGGSNSEYLRKLLNMSSTAVTYM